MSETKCTVISYSGNDSHNQLLYSSLEMQNRIGLYASLQYCSVASSSLEIFPRCRQEGAKVSCCEVFCKYLQVLPWELKGSSAKPPPQLNDGNRGTLEEVIMLHRDGYPHGKSTKKRMICGMFFYVLLHPLWTGPRLLFPDKEDEAIW